MRAVRLHGHGGVEMLQHELVREPETGEDDVLVQVAFCGLNHSDLNLRQGTFYGFQTQAGPVGWRQTPVRFPLIPGSDVAGRVVRVGSRVSGLQEGDRVALYPYISCARCPACLHGDDHLCPDAEYLGSERDGGYAEFVAVPARTVYRLPESVTLEDAAALPVNFLTAWHMVVTRGKLRAGESVMITGASGGVGSACVEIAKFIGARVLAVVGSRAKADRVMEIGSDAAAVMGRDDLPTVARRFSGSDGVDMVVEVVGVATWSASIQALRPEGRLVLCGAASGATFEIDLKQIYLHNLSVIGSTMGSPAEFEHLLDLLADRAIHPAIDCIYPLAEAREAQLRLEKREQFGKVMLRL